ncbi:hypothetical protein BV20DRAFT_1120421 [Pilatotrama ljubarskyi]|nr:hypothetical protein BV20DRAFT_1120421 [Pilatotrama ljubarskyi]
MPAPPLFQPSSHPPRFGPRIGTLTIVRDEGATIHQSQTPALLTATSRGIVPHLSRDHLHLTRTIRHIQLRFESFIDRSPPVPTLIDGPRPLHTFLGYTPEHHIITMTLRDPSDGRKMPPNGNDFVSAHCTRGVRKVTASAWKSWVQKCKPDIVVALSDTPFTLPPHSQKRLTKSIERSIAWLSNILKVPASSDTPDRPQHVLLHLAGGANASARTEFAERLTDPVDQRDAAELAPFNTLDEGVAGYVFDLLPLRASLLAEAGLPPVDEADLAGGLVRISDRHRSSPASSARLAELLQSSLEVLPQGKPRVLNSPASPHEVLRLVRDVGVDLIDSHWAQRAADMGIALDFRFPVPPDQSVPPPGGGPSPSKRKAGKTDLGHNLFNSSYVHDHTRLASAFLDGQSSAASENAGHPVCECGACSPRSPLSRILHSAVDVQAWQDPACTTSPGAAQPPFTRAYVHHLLHTHEMSAHALLAMHNLSVFSAFLAGIRAVLAHPHAEEEFVGEVARFEEAYDEELGLWAEAEMMWLQVERARGKGRLAREKEKQVESTIGTAVDI